MEQTLSQNPQKLSTWLTINFRCLVSIKTIRQQISVLLGYPVLVLSCGSFSKHENFVAGSMLLQQIPKIVEATLELDR
jgi:hypothetical protein